MAERNKTTGSGAAAAAQTSGRHNLPATGQACAAQPNGDRDCNPFEKTDTPLAAENAAQKRIEKWAARRYPVAALDGLPYPWARTYAASLARFNATRDPVTTPPTLIFAGDKVAGTATDEQLADLGPELTSERIEALQLHAAAIREDARAQVKMMARKMAAVRLGTAAGPPPPVTLAELLTEPDEDVVYRIAGLWPTAGRVLLAAQFKSGKTTLVGNVIRALVDGGDFLGRFATTPVRRVVLVDTEMGRGLVRRWLRDQGITRTDAVTVVPLLGSVSSFDILDPATRTEWVRLIGETDVLILDCLRPVLDALGLSEDKDAGKVLVAFDELLKEAGAAEGMVVTHMGHQNERARGDSRLLDWADALWKIVRGGEETDDDADRPRHFSALGRDVALPEGELTFDAATRHLSYQGGSRADAGARAVLPELLDMVAADPGKLSKRAAEARLRDETGVTQQDARAAIRKAIKDLQLTTMPGPKRAQLLCPAPNLSVEFSMNGDRPTS
jgi:AAA domain